MQMVVCFQLFSLCFANYFVGNRSERLAFRVSSFQLIFQFQDDSTGDCLLSSSLFNLRVFKLQFSSKEVLCLKGRSMIN